MNQIQGAWATLSGSETATAASAMVESDSSAFKFLDLTKTQRLYGFGVSANRERCGATGAVREV